MKVAKSKRLDLILEEVGLVPSRQVARTAIMDGCVLVNGVKITKPGTMVKDDARLELTGRWQPQRYVSRGGYKLEKALKEFSLAVENRICLDLGASTGGFTDCLLQHGAGLVFAVDVGYGQLDWSMRNHPQVIVRERINARKMCPQDIYGEDFSGAFASLAVIDLSFISISKVLPACFTCMVTEEPELIALIKPQFEAGPILVGKGGVVRSAQTHIAVIEDVLSSGLELGLNAMNLTYSPLKGPQGNIEFLVHWQAGLQAKSISPETISAVVNAAHEELSGQKPT